MKYIQQTDWFKAGRERAVKALDREYHESTDQTILEALGIESKSMLKSEAGGKERPGGRCL